MSVEAAHIIVHGRVQGVWFRASARDQASVLGVTGWVRNCPGGTVEIHAEADRESLDRFLEWCRTGPPSANVTHIDVNEVSPEGMKSFRVE